MKIYQKLAWLIGQVTFQFRNEEIEHIMAEAPSGSGIDCGTKLSEKSTSEKLIFVVEYHHMDDNGYYNGWTTHEIILRPSLAWGYDITITGQNRNEIKDYLIDVYSTWLEGEWKPYSAVV